MRTRTWVMGVAACLAAEQVQARFLSVDPLPVDANSGQNFNRYAYANNNPYKYIDPDGRYTCIGSHLNCGNVDKSMGRIKEASNSSKLTGEQRNAVGKVGDFYGKKGDDNVRISFSDNPLFGGGETYNKDGSVNITLTPDKSTDSLASKMVHEGQHGVDDKERGRPENSRSERRQTERNAYTTQSYFQKAVEFSRSSYDVWTPSGGISEKNINEQAEGSVIGACRGSSTGSCGN